MTTNISDPELAEYDEQFAQEETSDRGDPPDGDYTALIEKLAKEPGRKGDGQRVVWWLRIDGPTHAGRMMFRDTDIKTETIGIIKNDLRAVGFDIGTFKLSEFSARAPEALGRRVNITKKKVNGYARVYINGLALAPIDPSAPF